MTVFKRNYLVFALAVALCATMLGTFLFDGVKKLGVGDKSLQHTNDVIIAAERLASNVEAVLSAQRAYIITGNRQFKIQYDEKKATSIELMAQIANYVQDNPAQQTRLNHVQNQFDQLVKLLDERALKFVAEFKAHGVKSLNVDLVDTLREDITETIVKITEVEYQLLSHRFESMRKARDGYVNTLLIVCLVSLAILLVLNSYLLSTSSQKDTAESKLRETEERLKLALQATNEGVFDWNLKTNAVYWSPQFKEMLGYGLDEIEASVEKFKELAHPDDVVAIFAKVEAYLSGELKDFNITYRIKHRKGNWLWVTSRGKATFDDTGKPIRMVGTHADVTKTKEYEQRLHDEKLRAEAASNAKTDFLAHMSHEIRTPITAISGVAELLVNRRETLEPRVAKLVDTLKQSVSSLKDLIDDVLDFAKIENGDFSLSKTNYLPASLFAQVISIISVKAKEKNLTFRFEWAPELEKAELAGDSVRLRQILLNLAGNAVKFTNQGSVILDAKLVQDQDQNLLQVKVADTGIGIDADKLDKIFDKFQQEDNSVSRRFGGTGLGLSISRQLARLMGGDIKVESTKGHGSTFTFFMPAIFAAVHEPVSTPAVQPEMLEIVPAATCISVPEPVLLKPSNHKVLLVEDYQGNIDVISLMLEDFGYSVEVAENGLEAVEKIKNTAESTFAIVLMDVQMPIMDGHTAARTIRHIEKEEGRAALKIIGMTAHALAEDKQKCIDAGMDGFVQKPLTASAILNEIKQLEAEKNPKAA